MTHHVDRIIWRAVGYLMWLKGSVSKTSVAVARIGVIDRDSQEATSPLGAALYVCHPRFVNGYWSN